MDPISNKTALAAAGAAGAALYVDDVFSTYLYDGTGAAQTITNGIDLAGEGGLVWLKARTSATNKNHALCDTERGINTGTSPNQAYRLVANSTNQQDSASGLGSFNSDGFSLAAITNNNQTSNTYTSWTFRKAPGFFDVVTYTGTGSARTIAHSLGSVPGTIIIKRTNAASSWYVYHRSLGATKYLLLNQDYAEATGTIYFNDTEPTSSVFSVGTSAGVNNSGDTYVAYIFAHDDQSFGAAGDEAIIKCGSYTGTGSSGNAINLGFEPQWVMIKRTSSAGGWMMFDIMRGMPVDNTDPHIRADLSSAESSAGGYIDPTPTGFTIKATGGSVNLSGDTYVYVAIRRPHKPPEAATDVYYQKTGAGPYPAGFPVDLWWTVSNRSSPATSDPFLKTRLTGGTPYLTSSANNAEATGSDCGFDNNDGFENPFNYTSSINWMFRRAPGFFDVVTYSGTGSARTQSHNLAATPELIIVKTRNAAANWYAYVEALGNQAYLIPNKSEGASTGVPVWNNTSPTSSVFSLTGSGWNVNESGNTYVAYLFATLDGISKVGSYTGTGNNINVDCGFTAGARFVLIKRTDSTGHWYVWDTARGIVSGNDPYLTLNQTSAEATVSDFIDPLNSGFTITSSAPTNINASGGTYLFLAIA